MGGRVRVSGVLLRARWKAVAAASFVFAMILLGSGCTTQDALTGLSDAGAPATKRAVMLYFGTNGFSTHAPTNNTAQYRSLLQPLAPAPLAAATPAQCTYDTATASMGCSTVWGGYKMPFATTFASDLAGEVYVNSTKGAVLHSLEVQIYQSSDLGHPIAVLNTGNDPSLPARDAGGAVGYAQVGTGAKAVYLAGGAVFSPPAQLKKGDGLVVNVTVWGVGVGASAAASPLDINLVYGGKNQPSGFLFTSDEAPMGVANAGVHREYFTDAGLAPAFPAGTDAARAIDPASVTMSGPPWVAWGSFTTDRAMKVVGTGACTVWFEIQFTGQESGGIQAAVVANLTAGTKVLQKGLYGYGIATYTKGTSAPVSVKVVVPLPVRNTTIPAGTVVTLSFQIFGTTNENLGKLQIDYGSPAHPSGLFLPIEDPTLSPSTAGPSPSSSLSTTPSRSGGSSGGTGPLVDTSTAPGALTQDTASAPGAATHATNGSIEAARSKDVAVPEFAPGVGVAALLVGPALVLALRRR